MTGIDDLFDRIGEFFDPDQDASLEEGCSVDKTSYDPEAEGDDNYFRRFE